MQLRQQLSMWQWCGPVTSARGTNIKGSHWRRRMVWGIDGTPCPSLLLLILTKFLLSWASWWFSSCGKQLHVLRCLLFVWGTLAFLSSLSLIIHTHNTNITHNFSHTYFLSYTLFFSLTHFYLPLSAMYHHSLGSICCLSSWSSLTDCTRFT